MNLTSNSSSVQGLRGQSHTKILKSDILGNIYQNFTTSPDRINEWTLNLSLVAESPVNGTSMLPAWNADPLGGHAVWQVIIIVFLTGTLSLVTVVGNVLVLVSFNVNKALKTVNNYYLLSLAFADLTIGTLSMNLYTTYIIMDQWALGPTVCDLWLAIDYVASNASVMNLLVISFDRYFSVTRPLTYRAKRTTKRAMTMIGLAWTVSFVLWAPAILFWQYIVGERTVKPNECYIQFLSEPIITVCTAIAAFYLPVTIMAVLFWKIYQETEKRAKDVEGLKGSGSGGNPNPTRTGRKPLAMLKQVSSQSYSSLDLSPPVSGKKNPENISSSKCGTLCCRVPSLLLLLLERLPSRNSTNTNTSTVEEAEQSSGDSFKNNDRSVRRDQVVSQEEPPDSTGRTLENPITPPSSSSTPDRSPPGSTLITMKDAALAKRFASRARTEINKRKNEKKANERKAARTLSAILLAFISTWLPYNIMVLVNAFCGDCIPENLWALGYWLCYVNSTVNPMCYALCNRTFRTTFRDVLTCRWQQTKKNSATHFQQKKTVVFLNKDLA